MKILLYRELYSPFRQRRRNLAVLPAPLLIALARPAAASTTSGGSMPWDTILTTVQNDLTGPVATAVGVCACVIFGLSMAFGHEGSAMKRGMSILFGLAIAFTSASGILTLFGGGSGAVL